LIDLALSREINSHYLLRGTGIFLEEITDRDMSISPEDLFTLIENASKLPNCEDLSFLLGQHLLPGHFGDVSHALRTAADLRQALDYLHRYRAIISPLMSPELVIDSKSFHIVWRDSCGSGALRTFIVESAMTSVVAMTKLLSGERPPWKFSFRHCKPKHIEQYWVHLGEDLKFDWQLDMMSLPLEYLHKPWPGSSPTAALSAQLGSGKQLQLLHAHQSFLDYLHYHLLDGIRNPLSLESVAASFSMSPATLKRKLKKHRTSFQLQLDEVRKEVAIWLYHSRGYSNDEVAEWLNFKDVTNFRRSFRRWTGSSPSAIRDIWRRMA
jgi:AraC-like DNA-binding protein